jgi:GT2 family glycosyltransferase
LSRLRNEAEHLPAGLANPADRYRKTARPVWRTYMALRRLAAPEGSRWEQVIRLARCEGGRLKREGLGSFLRHVGRRLLTGHWSLRSMTGALEAERQYAIWLERHRLGPVELATLRADARELPVKPTISIVTPVYHVAEAWLREAIESVRAQAYEGWELCLVDDASAIPHVQRLLDHYAGLDTRIRVSRLPENRGIVAASNEGLRLASGEFVGFLDHDDVLYPDALLEVAKRLVLEPDLDFLYSDEDKIENDGRRVSPFFKPDWSPDLLLGVNYTCHFSVYRRALLVELGGLRPGFEGSQDHDLVLRFTERTRRIAHIPKILYGWRRVPASVAATSAAKPYAYRAAQTAVREALARHGREARVEMPVPGRYLVRERVAGDPKVSIVIPMRARADLTRRCLSSIEVRSTWKNVEVLIVDNGSVESALRRFLKESALRHRVVGYDGPLSYSVMNNFGARHATGDHLLFLNNDTEVETPDWLEAMLEHAQRAEVGAVGAKLLFPDRSIQHAGVIMGEGPARHAFKSLPEHTSVYFGLADVVRNVSAVTGACMMVRRQVFDQLGGFDEGIQLVLSDVDFCLRLRQAGYLVVYTPLATLIHHASAKRKTLDSAEDERLVRERWHELIDRGDPYYNPNLSRGREDFTLDV